ncbi:MAG: TOBE domain-containing protein [Sulfurimonadaceae bacterium]|jgi:molybdopterin-binding protein|nr:TOBE domain-containing protein [Sulfurimonadaceae bacterium]
MKISAKNQLQGRITSMKMGEVNCEVVIDIGAKQTITSVITVGAAKELGLKVGLEVTALIKANDVLVGVENE